MTNERGVANDLTETEDKMIDLVNVKQIAAGVTGGLLSAPWPQQLFPALFLAALVIFVVVRRWRRRLRTTVPADALLDQVEDGF
jgi:membrane protein implicated in regulation of membrane protease activity